MAGDRVRVESAGLIPPRLIAYGVGALALAALVAWVGFTVNGWRTDAAKLPGEIAARKQAEGYLESTREQIVRDDASRRALAVELEQTRGKVAALRNLPPVRSVVVREVPVHDGQTTCSDPRLSPDWGVRFNAYSLNPDPAG